MWSWTSSGTTWDASTRSRECHNRGSTTDSVGHRMPQSVVANYCCTGTDIWSAAASILRQQFQSLTSRLVTVDIILLTICFAQLFEHWLRHKDRRFGSRANRNKVTLTILNVIIATFLWRMSVFTAAGLFLDTICFTLLVQLRSVDETVCGLLTPAKL